MSLFGRLEQRSIQSAHPRDPALAEWFGGGARSHSGVSVTAESSLGLMPVWAAVRLICETLASLPLVLLKSDGNRRERATSHPLYRVLSEQPNAWQTSLEWREMCQAHVLLRGTCYNAITETRGGYPETLLPLHPDRVTPRHEPLRPGGPKVRYYKYSPWDEEPRIFLEHELFIVRGLSLFDMMKAVDPVANGREALGAALAAEEHGARFLANNVQPGGVLEHPGKLKPDAHQRLAEDMEKRRAGLAHAGKTLILEEGMKWHQIGMTNKDAQFLESRKFSVTEIARMFKVPPHMIADLDRATFSNIEHQGIEFVTHTMLPWFVRWEQRIKLSLLGPTERQTLYPKFIAAGLLRGDTKSRYEAYAIARQWGWLSANDIRELEDMNPIGPEGDIYFVPLNMVPADKAKDLPAPSEVAPEPAAEDDEEDVQDEERRVLRQRITVAHTRLFLDAAQRIMAKEINAAQRATQQARKQQSSAPLEKWLTDAYDADHEALVVRTLLPVFQSGVDSLLALSPELPTPDCEALAVAAARRHVSRQRAEVRKALQGTFEECAMAAETLVKAWESRAAALAGDEAVVLSAAVTRQLPAPKAA